MAIEPRRRDALAMLAGLGACATIAGPAFARAGDRVRLAASWEQQGTYHVGVLSAQSGSGAMLEVDAALEVPTRAHGLCVLPDGTVLATARRPGDWLVRWHPGRRTPPQWLWQSGERSFNGHVLASPDGRQIYTTETDAETGASWVAVRDARTLEVDTEWPTHGIDAHELIWDPHTLHEGAPTLIVANGGVPTAPETGRVKRNLDRMDSSLVRLSARTGRLLGQWRLPDPRLSLRHLAWSPDGRQLGIALQAEHDDTATRHSAPILALFDGQGLRVVATPEPMAQRPQGYGGSMAATPAGWAVSCPRANGIALFSLQGEWQGLVPLPEACPLAMRGGMLWAGGLDGSLQDAQATAPLNHPHGPALHGARLDNHWCGYRNNSNQNGSLSFRVERYSKNKSIDTR